MKYNGVIQRKLAILNDKLLLIEASLKGVTLKDFIANQFMQAGTERLLQLSIETIIDISERIIALEGVGPVDSSASAIKRLVQIGIIDSEEPFVNMVRFRNFIVHEYEHIDPTLVYTLAVKNIDDFRNFSTQILDS